MTTTTAEAYIIHRSNGRAVYLDADYRIHEVRLYDDVLLPDGSTGRIEAFDNFGTVVVSLDENETELASVQLVGLRVRR